MKVLILTYYFPPAGGSGVQRWLKFVKYLPELGIEPIVYTVDNPNYPLLDESLTDEIPNGITVLKQPIFEPNNILSIFGNKNKQSAGFLNPNPSKIGKVLQYIRANYFIPDARKYWIKPSVNYLEKYLENNKVDAIITTGPPHSIHLIGLALKNKLGINWIADFRDPWTDIDYFHQLPLTNKAKSTHFQLEKEVVNKADKVIVVGKTMQENYLKFNKNTLVITNGYDTFKSNKDEIKLDTKFSILHIGLMNADRNCTNLWKVLSEICNENSSFKNDLEIKLIGKVSPQVLNSLKESSLNENLNLINYIEHHKVTYHQKSAQVLLLSINNVPSAKGIITGKIFEYLQAKRPILAIAPKDGDLAEILKHTNAGKIVDFKEIDNLKEIILDYYLKYKNNKLLCTSINIEQYHRKNLTKKLVEVLKEN